MRSHQSRDRVRDATRAGHGVRSGHGDWRVVQWLRWDAKPLGRRSLLGLSLGGRGGLLCWRGGLLCGCIRLGLFMRSGVKHALIWKDELLDSVDFLGCRRELRLQSSDHRVRLHLGVRELLIVH